MKSFFFNSKSTSLPLGHARGHLGGGGISSSSSSYRLSMSVRASLLLILVALFSSPVSTFSISTNQNNKIIPSSSRATAAAATAPWVPNNNNNNNKHHHHHAATAANKPTTAAAARTAVHMTAAGGAASASASEEDGPLGEGTATITDEVFNLVKSVVGSGVLSLPAGIAAFGNAPSALLPAALLTASVGIISGYTFSMIGRVCSMTKSRTFSEAWDKTVGSESSWITAISCFIDCFFGNISYSMILADTFKSLLMTLGMKVTRTNALLGITSFVLLPLCLMKNLSSLAPFSLVGIIGMIYTSVAIAVRYFGGGYAVPNGRFLTDVAEKFQPVFGSTGVAGVFSPNALILICMLSTAYIAHFNAPKFYTELKNNTIDRFNVVTSWSFAISVAMYATVSALGFLTFGASCDGLILNNYSTKDLLMSIARIAVAVSVVFSYPLIFVGTRDSMLDLAKVPVEKRSNSMLNNLSLALLGIVTAISIKLTDLSFIASLSGATFGTALVFIFPSVMFRGAVKKMGDKASKKLKAESKFSNVIAALGCVIAALGTWMTFKGVEI